MSLWTEGQIIRYENIWDLLFALIFRRGGGEGAEQFEVSGQGVDEALWMPLDADAERAALRFDGFDNAVWRRGGNGKSRGNGADGLMVEAVDGEIQAEDARDNAAGRGGCLVAGPFAVHGLAVIEGALVIGKMLYKRAAEGDVHHLHAAADAEDGHAAGASKADQRDLVMVEQRIEPTDIEIGAVVVNERIDIDAAGHEHAVGHVEIGVQQRFVGRRRQHEGHSAAFEHGVGIRLKQSHDGDGAALSRVEVARHGDLWSVCHICRSFFTHVFPVREMTFRFRTFIRQRRSVLSDA